MYRLLMLIFCFAINSEAKIFYRIAICGVSRSSEELEMVLEMSSHVLIQKCEDKKLDAWIDVNSTHIQARSDSEIILVQRRYHKILSEKQAENFITQLFKILSKPKPKEKPISNPVFDPISNHESLPDSKPDIFEETELAIREIETPKQPKNLVWKLESIVSLDQWSYYVSTRAYPAFQMAIQYQWDSVLDWVLKTAWGMSAFEVGEQKSWNQQLHVDFGIKKNFDLGFGFWIAPQIAYLYWGSFSQQPEVPEWNQHDINLSCELGYLISSLNLDIFMVSSFLPVNLGSQNRLGFRYYFSENWFASLQGEALFVKFNQEQASFLSTGFGLGLLL